MGHSCRTRLWDTLIGHSCGTLLWDTLVGHSCGTLRADDVGDITSASSAKRVLPYRTSISLKPVHRAVANSGLTLSPGNRREKVLSSCGSDELSTESATESTAAGLALAAFAACEAAAGRFIKSPNFYKTILFPLDPKRLQLKNNMEPTNPNANTIEKLHMSKRHSCRTLLWDTLLGHSCRTLLWVTCRTLL